MAKPKLHPRKLPKEAKAQKAQPNGNVTAAPKPISNGQVLEGKDPVTGKFLPGHKLSPGRPKGSKDKWGKGIIDCFKDREEELSHVALEAAIKDGKVPAMAMILDRLAAKADSQPIRFKPVTNLQTLEDVRREQQAIVSAVYQGELTPRQAETLQRILETYAASIREAQQISTRQRFERDERLLAKARQDPLCLAAASAFVTRLHTLDLPDEAWQHPAIEAAVAVVERT